LAYFGTPKPLESMENIKTDYKIRTGASQKSMRAILRLPRDFNILGYGCTSTVSTGKQIVGTLLMPAPGGIAHEGKNILSQEFSYFLLPHGALRH
jgi:hypothetical protein